MRPLPIAAAFVLLLDATAIAADPTAIKEQAARLNEFKGLLTADDPAIQAAAFQAMTDSQDRTARKLAIDTGIASDDPTLQGLALRYTVGDLNNIVIEFSQEDLKKEAFKDFVKKYGNRYAINIQRFDYGSGKFSGVSTIPSGGTYQLTGQIAGTALQFVSYTCSGNFHFNQENRAAFTGTMSCETFPAIQGGFRIR